MIIVSNVFSAYCGGLWLAALFAMTKFAEILNKPDDKQKYSILLEKGKKAYDKKLWNGKYYNFDCSEDEFESIMADQLCGHWYLSCSGYGDEVIYIFTKKNAHKTNTI